MKIANQILTNQMNLFKDLRYPIIVSKCVVHTQTRDFRNENQMFQAQG